MYISLFLALILHFLQAAAWPYHIKTYSVHASCYEKIPWFDQVIFEAQQMAIRAHRRTQMAQYLGDPDWERVFRFFMKVDIRDQTLYPNAPERIKFWNMEFPEKSAVQHVLDTLDDLANNWYQVADPAGHADVRIQCNNMKHWTEETSGEGVPLWLDKKNLIISEHGWHCTKRRSTGFTFGGKIQSIWKDVPDDPNPIRSVIALCDIAFSEMITVRGEPFTKKLDDKTNTHMMKVNMILSGTIFHEWLHTTRFFFMDHRPADAETNPDIDPAKKRTQGLGYVNSVSDPKDAIFDPECLSYLGVFALLADRRPVLTEGEEPSKTGGYGIRADIANLAIDSTEMQNGDILEAFEYMKESDLGPY